MRGGRRDRRRHMSEAIGEILPLAVGIAVSPVPVIAVILMLLSQRARPNSLAFTTGWIVGIVGTSVVVLAIARSQDLTSEGEPSDGVSWAKLLIGLLLLLLAVKQWRQRPASGAEAVMPKWMAKIDAMKPMTSLGLAIVLSALNPKNLLLTMSAAVAIAQAELSSGDAAVSIAVFTVVAASTVVAPTLAHLFGGQRVQPTLDRMKVWLTENNATVMAVLLLVIGTSLFGKGIGALL
jgi:threonine/homoserine/homoserine lactone efflux protein